MTTWNEDNFLERLAPELRQNLLALRGACPDADVLCAVRDGTIVGPLRKAMLEQLVIEHCAHCPVCADLRNRLAQFETGSAPEQEAEWIQTRDRLDKWFEDSFRSQAASFRPFGPLKRSWTFLLWEGIASSLRWWWVRLALGTVAALLLIMSGVLLEKLGHERVPQSQAALRGTVPPAPQAEAPQPVPAPAPAPSLHQPRVEATRPQRVRPRVAPRVSPPSAVAARPRNPTIESAENRPLPQPFPSASMSRQRAPQASAPRSGLSRRPGAGALTSPAIRAPLPPYVQLTPSSHLLMVVSSIEWEPDKTFRFQGVLLVGFPQSGSVWLEQGAQVIGTGALNQGQTSVVVTEFVVGGVRYPLKNGNGAMRAQTPGASGEVQFERSQTLELWPQSDATYERTHDEAVPPEPPK
jgi:hypothetical protein